jgi:3-oxoadipate enol-lactonase
MNGKMTMEAPVAEPAFKWVDVEGGQSAKLATESLGAGLPFVWGHALLGSMSQDLDGEVLAWRELTDIAQVIRFDARGHGQSGTEGDSEDFRWDNLARSMWQVIDSYTDEKVVIGGASMGCATSLYAACQRPEQVKGLVLVIPPTAWESRKKMQRNYRIIAHLVNLTLALPFQLLRLVPPAGEEDGFQRRVLSVMAKHLVGVKREGVVGAMHGASLSDLPSKEALEKLTMPTLILAWPDDDAHPLAVAEKLQDILPNTQLEVMKHVDDPYHWPQLVREFITSLN